MSYKNSISKELKLSLDKIEKEIDFIIKNSTFLNFGRKSWASSPEGQKLVYLSIAANNLRYSIWALESNGY